MKIAMSKRLSKKKTKSEIVAILARSGVRRSPESPSATKRRKLIYGLAAMSDISGGSLDRSVMKGGIHSDFENVGSDICAAIDDYRRKVTRA